MELRHETVLVAGRPVRYRIRRSARARRPAIQVSKRDGVVVVLPRRAPLVEAPRLIAASEAWLDRMVQRHGVADGPLRRDYATGSEIRILGEARRLVLMALPPDRQRPRIGLGETTLVAELRPVDILTPRPVLEKYLRKLARQDLRERVARLAESIGLWPARVIVGERTTRWGSCSGRGTLSFCFRLVMAPPAVIDAVVAHEICHLRHMNHGRRFQRLVTLACPDHDEQMKWLREHEDELLF